MSINFFYESRKQLVHRAFWHFLKMLKMFNTIKTIKTIIDANSSVFKRAVCYNKYIAYKRKGWDELSL